MITQDESGYPVVKADRQINLGEDTSKWSTIIYKYIRDQIRNGKDILIKTVEGRSILLTSAAQKHLRTRGGMGDDTYRVKLNAAGHIDEIIAVIRDVNPSSQNAADDGRHPELASKGWRYYDSVFENYDGRQYLIRLSVGQSEDGEIAYNIGRVREINNHPSNDRRLTEGRSPLDYASQQNNAGEIGSDDNKLITQPGPTVNPQQQTAPAVEIQTDDGGETAAATVGNSGSVAKLSYSSWTQSEQDRVRQELVNTGLFTDEQIDKWISDANSIAAQIAADRTRLDYKAADNQTMLKDNAEYVKTLDSSTLCAKRRLYQGTFNAIQKLLPNTVITSDMLIHLRNMMAEGGYETPCGICYVESRRRNLGVFTDRFLKSYEGDSQGYKPTMADLTTTDGLEALRENHPEVYDAYQKAMAKTGSNNLKVVQPRTEYRREISRLTEGQIRKILEIGGIRISSFSDFETPHLLDMMQVVLDMSSKQLTAQAYTKVPNFAAVFGGTGIKINLCLIGEGSGLDANGNLAFSSYEGMEFDTAMALRDMYPDNVGTIREALEDVE